MLQVRVVGYLGLVEVIFLVLAPVYLLSRYRTLTGGLLRPFLILSVAWLGSAVFTDLYRNTPLQDALKGAFTVILWIACLICMYVMLSRRLSLIRWYALGLAFSTWLSLYILQPGTIVGRAVTEGKTSAEVISFRNGYAGVIAAFVAAFAVFSFRKYPRLVMAAIFGFALLTFVFGSRSLGGIYLMAGLITYYFHRQAALKDGWRRFVTLSRRQRLKLGVIFLLASVLTVAGFQFASSRGWLGEMALARTAETSESDIGLLSARAQLIFGALAIYDSPLIGFGSWAKDTHGYYLKGATLLGLDRLATALLVSQEPENMPGHSHIVGTWVYHGLLGGLFWIFVFIFLARFLLRNLPGDMTYLAFSLLVILGTMWSVLFSPFGSRAATAAKLVFLVVCAEQTRRQRRAALRPAAQPQAGPGPPALEADEDR